MDEPEDPPNDNISDVESTASELGRRIRRELGQDMTILVSPEEAAPKRAKKKRTRSITIEVSIFCYKIVNYTILCHNRSKSFLIQNSKIILPAIGRKFIENYELDFVFRTAQIIL